MTIVLYKFKYKQIKNNFIRVFHPSTPIAPKKTIQKPIQKTDINIPITRFTLNIASENMQTISAKTINAVNSFTYYTPLY